MYNRLLRTRACIVAGMAMVTTMVAFGPSTPAVAQAAGGVPASAKGAGTKLPWPASPNWQQYVQSPSSRHVSPVSVLSATSNVTNPQALVHPGSGQTTTLTRTRVGLADSGPDSWPAGTTASASSYHSGVSNSGHSFSPSNALDGNPATYWNNANAGSTHSWLEISTPAPVSLSAATLLFSPNGVPVDFQIQTWDATSSSWVTQVTVSGNASTTVAKLFPAPVTTQHLRIYITLDQAAADGQYSRIAEVYPFYSPPTHLILDYGKDVGGVPKFNVVAESGSPQLQAGYSEGRQYISPTGDGGNSQSAAGDPRRYDVYTVSKPGVIVNPYIQGGERYEELTLLTPGSVTLSSAWIHFTAYRAGPSQYQGHFISSSAQLNRFWYDGAYTVQLDQLPARTLSALWSISNGSLDARGTTTGAEDIGLLGKGAAWTDYTDSFQTQILNYQAGWVVRASSTSGYLFILDAANDPGARAGEGSPNTLQELYFNNGSYHLIASVPLAENIVTGSWYNVQTQLSATGISISVNGRLVSTVNASQLPAGAPSAGTVGFREYGAEQALFRDLAVTSPSGSTLFANSLASPSALSYFTGPPVAVPDPLPVIMDGAKRDRVVWSGDLGVEGPNIYYSTAANRYVKGSLGLLSSYQNANGESGTNVPPTVPLGTFPASGFTYSASYSMDEVDNIATYYSYTGNRSFLRAQWPMIQRELAYNRSLVGSQGLLVTNASNGRDWDYYDGPKVGAVTAYNDIYYRTLQDAATMAAALGLKTQANSYSQEAAALRSAINTYLYDPSTGLYNVSDLKPGTAAQDGNSLAVLYGVAPKSRAKAILAALQKALPSTPYGPSPFTANTGYSPSVSPFITNEEVQALYAVGDTSAATGLVRQLWGYMDNPQGTNYTGADWEVVGTNGAPGFGGFTSLAHGWASGATADLSQYVLGVAPVGAGYRSWAVDPHPGALSWSEGQVPTPHGPITVDWGHETTQGRFVMKLQAPSSSTGTIGVPDFGRQSVIHVNGHQVWDNGKFHAAVGVVGATLEGQDVVLHVNPAAVAHGSASGTFLVVSKATGRAT